MFTNRDTESFLIKSVYILSMGACYTTQGNGIRCKTGKKRCNVLIEYMTLKIQVEYVNEFEAAYKKNKEEVIVVVGPRDKIPSGKATFN